MNLNCNPCPSGFERPADTTPVDSAQPCIASTCSSTQVPNSDRASTNSIAGTTDDSVIVTCLDGFSGGGVWTCSDGDFSGAECVETSCVLPTIHQTGYSTPETWRCTGEGLDQPFTIADLSVTLSTRFSVAGAWLCENAPSCDAGYGGEVSFSCVVDGAELLLSGCAQLPCSAVTCTYSGHSV